MKERYKLGKIIGEGSFGVVRIAQHRHANVKCAIKRIKKENLNGKDTLTDLMNNELQVLEETSHPNIVRVYELLHDDDNIFIVSEYIKHGELYSFI